MASVELIALLETERARVRREKKERKKLAEWLVEVLLENSALRDELAKHAPCFILGRSAPVPGHLRDV